MLFVILYGLSQELSGEDLLSSPSSSRVHLIRYSEYRACLNTLTSPQHGLMKILQQQVHKTFMRVYACFSLIFYSTLGS